jgi:hypothetical protein
MMSSQSHFMMNRHKQINTTRRRAPGGSQGLSITRLPGAMALGIALALTLGGCQENAATQANFTTALQKHFEGHGDLCIGRHAWPVDVPDLPMASGLRDGIQMPALEHAGLVAHVSAEMTQPHRDGTSETVKALRYDLTDKGRAFVKAHPLTAARVPAAGAASVADADVCYGTIKLEKVMDWTPPTKADGDAARQTTVVRYTYTFDAAPWTADRVVQKAFPVLASVVHGSGSMVLSQDMVQTDSGWMAR